MSEEEGIRQFESQFGDLDPELESSFRKYIVDRDEPLYEAVNKRLLPSHLQDCIKDGVCPNRGYTPIPPTPTQKGEMNRDKQEWGAESMISGSTLASVGGVLALGAGLSYMSDKLFGDYFTSYANRFLRQRQRQPEQIQRETIRDEGGIRGNTLRDIDRLEEIRQQRDMTNEERIKNPSGGLFPPTPGKEGLKNIKTFIIHMIFK